MTTSCSDTHGPAPADTDAATGYFQRFVDAEYAVNQAMPDDPAHVAKVLAAAEAFLGPGLMLPNGPAALGLTDRFRVSFGPDEPCVPRTLFAVAVYEDGERGSVWEAYVSYYQHLGALTYALRLRAVLVGGRRLIVSIDRPDIDCPGQWLTSQGQQFHLSAQPVAVRALAEPRRAAHRQHWAQLTGAGG
ncbi:hypothetical protein ACFVUW_10540 [Streptomyces xiamenensis]|uniref:hypothetical protein n=1 Tax=Streptomyces xiamenensis TaxID=408015 RepID=UPI0036E3EC06